MKFEELSDDERWLVRKGCDDIAYEYGKSHEHEYGEHNQYIISNNSNGFLIYYHNDEGGIWLSKIYVIGCFRKSGVGTEMIRTLENLYPDKQISLGISPKNENSFEFFKRIGYKEIMTMFSKN